MLEKLSSPPIVEVVTGVIFAPLRGLDPVAAGALWSTRREEYPRHEIRPIVANHPFQIVDGPQLRTMLFHHNGSRVLQVQSDRFYVNWRRPNGDTIEGARAGEYPRFTDRDGRKGLGSVFAEEFAAFSTFCQAMKIEKPTPLAVEMAKIDLLIENVDWTGLDQLYEILPWLAIFSTFATSGNPTFIIRLDEPRPTGALSVALSQSLVPDASGKAHRVVQVETSITKPLNGMTVSEAVVASNAELNDVFDRLIPEPQRARLFSREREVS